MHAIAPVFYVGVAELNLSSYAWVANTVPSEGGAITPAPANNFDNENPAILMK